ncbi:MAG TPA: hypothetical protein VN788_13185, partial [Verrucomicrobiae bacterium]|nr:hypothetical protein [Verrucomicrobiae bacterium]
PTPRGSALVIFLRRDNSRSAGDRAPRRFLPLALVVLRAQQSRLPTTKRSLTPPRSGRKSSLLATVHLVFGGDASGSSATSSGPDYWPQSTMAD